MKLVNALLLATAVAGAPGTAKADVVTDWNTIAVTTVTGDAVVNRQSRAMAMVHAAMFDAMNAIRTQYTPALVSITGIQGYASRELAGATAAHDVLIALFPAKKPQLDANLAAVAAQIPDDPLRGKQPKARGTDAGQQAAAAVLALRAHDHAFDVVPYTQQPAAPGVYQFTPGCTAANISAPGYGNVTPFTLADPDGFPLPPAPSTSDPEWLASMAETRDYGSATSALRTADQTQIALFFLEPSVGAVNRLARTLIAQEPVQTNRAAAAKQLLAHARLFAALNIAQADTYIRTWRSKYGNNFWRPYTAIRSIGGDPTWTPLRQTPCHPEFFAAHGTLSPAGYTALQNYFGDAINADATSTTLVGVTRHYTSLNQLIEDVNGARIWAGFHYRSTLVRSNVLGRAVANWVNANMMVLVADDDGTDDTDGHYQGQAVSGDYDGSNNENDD